MATNAAFKGEVMPFTNTAATTIDSGDVVAIETAALGQVTAGATLVGVALGDIAQNIQGQLAVSDVWELPKNAASDVFSVGDQIGITSGKVIAATTSNLAVNARVFKASANGEATVFVKLS